MRRALYFSLTIGFTVALAMIASSPTMAADGCDLAFICPSTAPDSASALPEFVHFFGDSRHLQAAADQVQLASQPGPLPITLSGNVQTWTSGPPQSNLYTESAQTYYQLDKNWKILGQELYQQQASITLANLVGGVNYKPNDEFNINLMAGAGIHTLYTYQWAVFVSPQYTLPWTIGGTKRLAIEADTTFENYTLGNFTQIIPKLDINVTNWLPQLQIGYALGRFEDATLVSRTQYYQPQTVHGPMLTAVANPFRDVFLVISYLPANKDYIAGNYVTQNTFSGTMHLNLTEHFRLSFYGEDTWYQGGGDRALGGGVNWAF